MENTLANNERVTQRSRMDASSRVLLIGVAVVTMTILVATLAARLTGYTPSSIPDSTIVETRELGFRDLPGGVVEVFEWQSGKTLLAFPAGEGAFLRGVVRSLVRQRRGMDAGIASMFMLTRHDDGRVVLSDPATGESIDLVAFGATNLAVFDQLFDNPAGSDAAAADW